MSKRVWMVALIAIIAGALGYLAFAGIGENLVYYWSPAEMRAAGDQAIGATIRLGGQVKPGSIQWDASRTDLKFEVTDGKDSVQVHGSQMPPQMFREGIGVVVEGTLTPQGVFTSQRLMVKHSNEYKAPEEGHDADTEELFKSLKVDADNPAASR